MRFQTVDELGAELFPKWDKAKRRRWVYRCVEEKGAPAVKVGRSLYLDSTAFGLWLANRRVGDWNGS